MSSETNRENNHPNSSSSASAPLPGGPTAFSGGSSAQDNQTRTLSLEVQRELKRMQQSTSTKSKIPPPLPAPAPRPRYDVRVTLSVTFNPTSIFVCCINNMFPNETMWAKIVAPKISSLIDSVKQQLHTIALDQGYIQGHKAAVDAGFLISKSKDCVVPKDSGVSIVRRAAVSNMRMKKLTEEERVAVNQEWSTKKELQQQQAIEGSARATPQQPSSLASSPTGAVGKTTTTSSLNNQTSLSAHIAEEVAAAIREIPDLVTVDAFEPFFMYQRRMKQDKSRRLPLEYFADPEHDNNKNNTEQKDGSRNNKNEMNQIVRNANKKLELARDSKKVNSYDVDDYEDETILDKKRRELLKRADSSITFDDEEDGRTAKDRFFGYKMAKQQGATNSQQQHQQQDSKDGDDEEVIDNENENEGIPKYQVFQKLSLPPQMRFNDLSQSVILADIIDTCCDYDHQDPIALKEKRKCTQDESKHPLLWSLVLVHTSTHSPIAGTAGLILPIASQGNAELRTDPSVVQVGGGSSEQMVVTTLTFEWTVPASWAEVYETKKKKNVLEVEDADDDSDLDELDELEDAEYHKAQQHNNSLETDNNTKAAHSEAGKIEDEDKKRKMRLAKIKSEKMMKLLKKDKTDGVEYEDERKNDLDLIPEEEGGLFTAQMQREQREQLQQQQQAALQAQQQKKKGETAATPSSTPAVTPTTANIPPNIPSSTNTDNKSAAAAATVLSHHGSLPATSSWFPPKHQTWSLAQVRWKRKRMMRHAATNNARDFYSRIYNAITSHNGDIRRIPPILLDALTILSEIEAGTIRADSVDERRRAPLLWMLENASRLPHAVLREAVLTLLDLGSPNFLCQSTYSRRIPGESYKNVIDVLRSNSAAREIVLECQIRINTRLNQSAALLAKRKMLMMGDASMSSVSGSHNHINNSSAANASASSLVGGPQMAALRDPVLDIPPGRCRFACFSATKEHVVYTVSPEGRLLLWDIKLRNCIEMAMMAPGSRVLAIPLFPLTKKGQTLRQRLTICHPHAECDMLLLSSGEILTVDFASTSGPRVNIAARTEVKPDLFEGDGQGWCCAFAWNTSDYMPKSRAEIDRATRVAKHIRELGARTDILRSDDEVRMKNAESAAASLNKAVSNSTSSAGTNNTKMASLLTNTTKSNNNNESTTSNTAEADLLRLKDSNTSTYKEILPPGVVSARDSHIQFGRRLVMYPYGQSKALAESYEDRDDGADHDGDDRDDESDDENDEDTSTYDMIERSSAFKRSDEDEAVKKMILATVHDQKKAAASNSAKKNHKKNHKKRRSGRNSDQAPSSATIINKHLAGTSSDMDTQQQQQQQQHAEGGEEPEHDQQQQLTHQGSVRFVLENHKADENDDDEVVKTRSSSFRSRFPQGNSSSNNHKNLLRHNKGRIPPPPIAVLAAVIDSRPIVLHIRASLFAHLDVTASLEKRAKLLAEAIDESLKCVQNRRASSSGNSGSNSPNFGSSLATSAAVSRADSFSTRNNNKNMNDNNNNASARNLRRNPSKVVSFRLHQENDEEEKKQPVKQTSTKEEEETGILDEIARHIEEEKQKPIQQVESDDDDGDNGDGDDAGEATPRNTSNNTTNDQQLHRRSSSRATITTAYHDEDISSPTAVGGGSFILGNNNKDSRLRLHHESFGTACPETYVTGLVFSASCASTNDPILFAMADGNLIEYRVQTRSFNVFKSSLKLEQLPQDGPAETAVFRIARGHATCCVVAPIMPDPAERDYAIQKGITPDVTTSFCAWCGKDFAVSTSTIENKTNHQSDPKTPSSVFEPYVTVPDDAADSERTTAFVLPHLFSKQDEFYSHLLIVVRRGELCVLDTRRSSRVLRLLRIEATETELVLRRRLGDVFNDNDEEAALSSGLKICNVSNEGNMILVTCRDFDSAAVFHADVLKEAISRAIVAGLPSRHRELELISQSVIEEETAKRQLAQLEEKREQRRKHKALMNTKGGGSSMKMAKNTLDDDDEDEEMNAAIATLTMAVAGGGGGGSSAMPKESLLSFWSRFVCPDKASFASKCQHIGFFMRLLEIAIKGTHATTTTTSQLANENASSSSSENPAPILSFEEYQQQKQQQLQQQNGKSKIRAGTVGIHARDGKGGTIFHSFSTILMSWDLSIFSIDVARRWLTILLQHRVNFWIPCNKYRPVDAFRSDDDVFQLSDVFRRENDIQEHFLSPLNLINNNNDILSPTTTVACDPSCLCDYEDYVHVALLKEQPEQEQQQQIHVLSNNAHTGGSQLVLGNSNGKVFVAFGGHLFCLVPYVDDGNNNKNNMYNHQRHRQKHDENNIDDENGEEENEEADFSQSGQVPSVRFTNKNNKKNSNASTPEKQHHQHRNHNPKSKTSSGNNKDLSSSTVKKKLLHICPLPYGKNIPFIAMRHSDLLEQANTDILLTEDGTIIIVSITPSSTKAANNNNNFYSMNNKSVFQNFNDFSMSFGASFMNSHHHHNSFSPASGDQQQAAPGEFDVEIESFSLDGDILSKKFKDKFDNRNNDDDGQLLPCGILKASVRSMNLHPEESIFFGQSSSHEQEKTNNDDNREEEEDKEDDDDEEANGSKNQISLTAFFTLATREKNREEACIEIISRVAAVTINTTPQNIASCSSSSGCKELSRLLQLALHEAFESQNLSCAIATKFSPETPAHDIFLAENCTIRDQSEKEKEKKMFHQKNNSTTSVPTNASRHQLDSAAGAAPTDISVLGLALVGKYKSREQLLKEEDIDYDDYDDENDYSNTNLVPEFEGFSWSFNTKYAISATVPGELVALDAGSWPTGPCKGFSKLNTNPTERTSTISKTLKTTCQATVTAHADFLISLSRGPELFVFKRSPKSAHASSLLLPSLHLDPEPDAAFPGETIQSCWGSRRQEYYSKKSSSDQNQNHNNNNHNSSTTNNDATMMYSLFGEQQQEIIEMVGERSEALYILRDGLLLVYDVQTELLLILGKVHRTNQEYERLRRCEPEVSATLSFNNGNEEEFAKRNIFSPNDIKKERELFDPTLASGEEMLVWDDTNDLDELRTNALLDHLYKEDYERQLEMYEREKRDRIMLELERAGQQQVQQHFFGGGGGGSLGSAVAPLDASFAFLVASPTGTTNLSGDSSANNFFSSPTTSASQSQQQQQQSGNTKKKKNKSSSSKKSLNDSHEPMVSVETANLLQRITENVEREMLMKHGIPVRQKKKSDNKEFKIVYRPHNDSYYKYTRASAKGSLLPPLLHIDSIFRISLTHGFISTISLRAENVMSFIESDAPPLLLCHRSMPARLPKPIPTKLLRSSYQMRSSSMFDAEDYEQSKNASSSSSWITPYLVELCGRHNESENQQPTMHELIDEDGYLMEQARSIVKETSSIKCGVRDGDGLLPFYIFGKWLQQQQQQQRLRNTASQQRQALNWCRRLLFLGHSPYLSASSHRISTLTISQTVEENNKNQEEDDLSLSTKSCPECPVIAFSNELAPLLAKIEKEASMKRPEIATVNCPICIYDGETLDDEDQIEEANDDITNYEQQGQDSTTKTATRTTSLSSSIVVQMSWSCARSGLAYLLTEDGGLCLSVWMEDSRSTNNSSENSSSGEEEELSSSTKPLKNIQKQLLPPFTLPQGLTMFVTSMRDFTQIREMHRQRDDPIKSMEDHFAVPPLTWQLSQVVEDILFFSDGSIFTVRIDESEESTFFHARIEKLLRSVSDYKQDDDYDPKKVDGLHFCWKDQSLFYLAEEEEEEENSHNQSSRTTTTTKENQNIRNAGHLHNGSVEGVTAKWLETVNVNPNAPCCTLICATERPNGDVGLYIRNLFSPSGIPTLFPRHIPTMLQESCRTKSSSTSSMINLEANESWLTPTLVHEHRVSDLAKHRATIRFVARSTTNNNTSSTLRTNRWCIAGGCYAGGCWIVDEVYDMKRKTVELVCKTKFQFPWRRFDFTGRNRGFPVEFLMCRDFTLPDAFKTAVLAAGFAEGGISVGAYRHPPKQVQRLMKNKESSTNNSSKSKKDRHHRRSTASPFSFVDDDEDEDQLLSQEVENRAHQFAVSFAASVNRLDVVNHHPENDDGNNNKNNDDAGKSTSKNATIQMECRCDAVPSSIFRHEVSPTSAPLCYGAQHPHEPIVVSLACDAKRLLIFDWQRETLHSVDISRYTKKKQEIMDRVLTIQEKQDQELDLASSGCILKFSACGNFLSTYWMHIKSVFVFDFSKILWNQKSKRPFILTRRYPRAHARANARFISQMKAGKGEQQEREQQKQEGEEFAPVDDIPVSARKRQQLRQIVASAAASSSSTPASSSSFVDPVLSEVVNAFKNAAKMGTITPHTARDAENCSWLHRAASQLCYILAKKKQQKRRQDGNDNNDMIVAIDSLDKLEKQTIRDVFMAVEFGCGFFCFNSSQVRPFDELFRAVEFFDDNDFSDDSHEKDKEERKMTGNPIRELLLQNWAYRINNNNTSHHQLQQDSRGVPNPHSLIASVTCNRNSFRASQDLLAECFGGGATSSSSTSNYYQSSSNALLSSHRPQQSSSSSSTSSSAAEVLCFDDETVLTYIEALDMTISVRFTVMCQYQHDDANNNEAQPLTTKKITGIEDTTSETASRRDSCASAIHPSPTSSQSSPSQQKQQQQQQKKPRIASRKYFYSSEPQIVIRRGKQQQQQDQSNKIPLVINTKSKSFRSETNGGNAGGFASTSSFSASAATASPSMAKAASFMMMNASSNLTNNNHEPSLLLPQGSFHHNFSSSHHQQQQRTPATPLSSLTAKFRARNNASRTRSRKHSPSSFRIRNNDDNSTATAEHHDTSVTMNSIILLRSMYLTTNSSSQQQNNNDNNNNNNNNNSNSVGDFLRSTSQLMRSGVNPFLMATTTPTPTSKTPPTTGESERNENHNGNNIFINEVIMNGMEKPNCSVVTCGASNAFVLVFVSHSNFEGFCMIDLSEKLEKQKMKDTWNRQKNNNRQQRHRYQNDDNDTPIIAYWTNDLREISSSTPCHQCFMSIASSSSPLLNIFLHFPSKNDFIADRLSCCSCQIPGLDSFNPNDIDNVLSLIASKYATGTTTKTSSVDTEDQQQQQKSAKKMLLEKHQQQSTSTNKSKLTFWKTASILNTVGRKANHLFFSSSGHDHQHQHHDDNDDEHKTTDQRLRTAVSEFSVHRIAVCKVTSNVVVQFKGGSVVMYPFVAVNNSSSSSLSSSASHQGQELQQHHHNPVRLDVTSCIETAFRDQSRILALNKEEDDKKIVDVNNDNKKSSKNKNSFTCDSLAISRELVVGVFSPSSSSDEATSSFSPFITIWDIQYSRIAVQQSSASAQQQQRGSSNNQENITNSTIATTATRRAQGPIGNDVKTVLHLIIKNDSSSSSSSSSSSTVTMIYLSREQNMIRSKTFSLIDLTVTMDIETCIETILQVDDEQKQQQQQDDEQAGVDAAPSSSIFRRFTSNLDQIDEVDENDDDDDQVSSHHHRLLDLYSTTEMIRQPMVSIRMMNSTRRRKNKKYDDDMIEDHLHSI